MNNTKKKILCLLAAALSVMMLCLVGCRNNKLPEGTPVAVMTFKDMGTVEIELDASAAPITVANFVKLAESGFYDGLTVHRVLPGLILQGGDPKGNGTGSSDPIKGEFAANGVENPLSHTRGVISMARRDNDYNSGSCQFFILAADYTGWDGQYAAFGRVVSGMEIIDYIVNNTPIVDRNGSVAKANQPVIESVVIEYR